MLFIKNMKLRSKMMYGFSLSIILMLTALGFALYGLTSNSDDIEMMNVMSQEANLAAQIQKELLESQMVFKEFQISGNTDLSNRFNSHETNMMRYLETLKETNINEERKSYVAELEQAMIDYSGGFKTYQALDETRLEYYGSVGQSGADIIDSLGRLSETAHDLASEEVQMGVGRSLENILLARLNAMKFFTFHEYDDYLAYQESFDKFKAYFNNLSSIQKNLNYKSDYITAHRNLGLYEAGMSELYLIINNMDDQIDAMDAKEKQITSMIYMINNSVLYEQSQFESNIEAQVTRYTSVATVVSVLAIIMAIAIASWILRLVLVPIHSLRSTFEGISTGNVDLDFRLPDASEDEIGLMSRAFNKFMVNLKSIMDDVNYQNWSKTAQNELNGVIRDQNDMVTLSQSILTYLCHYIDAQVGTLYLNMEDELSLVASYAFSNRKGLKEAIKFGDGLVGQSALEKKIFIIEDLPESYMAVQSGLGSSQPTSVAVVPCTYENEVKCVIEIGTLKAMTEKELNLLELLAEAIAVALHSTDVRIKMRELLDKTVHQSEELQMQQEELRQSNEELEEQTRALKESEQRLQAQQEELRVSNEELEQRTKQLEHQKKSLDENNKELMLKQQEIIEKAEALELANTYKSEFLANMSHELRTPLNSILVLSQLLSDRDASAPLSQKESEFAETINTSGQDLLTLINDILDLSKVEAGHLDIHHDDIKLTELLRDSENMFKPMADVKNIVFRTELISGLPATMVSDTLRIQQIIKNLVSNAIKFTHSGEVVLSLRKPSDFECDAINCKVDDYIAIEVSDTGIGIPGDKQQLIFEAFRQTDGTTSRKYGGTGLGLTISRELSHLLGGQIILESKEGEGSKFVFILPLKSGEVDTEPQKHVLNSRPSNQAVEPAKLITKTEDITSNEKLKPEKSVADGPKVESNNTLLIIEDDNNFSSILASLSEEKGFDCRVAHNGEMGLELAIELKPSAIILDLGLPDVDGMELAEKLGRLKETSHIPIHIISGMEKDAKSLMPSSVIGFLKKPVDIKTIYKTLSKIETVSSSDFKKLLVVGHCSGESFERFTSLGQVEVVKVKSGAEAVEMLETDMFECIVLDIELKDMHGEVFLEKLTQTYGNIPVVIYSEAELSPDKLSGLNKYTDNIILKSPKSEERLLDEVSLFLHGMSESIKESAPSPARRAAVLDEIKHKVVSEDMFEGKKILVVDDDDRNVFAISNVLKKHGFDVLVAQDGLESIEMFKKDLDIDLVLMDIMMPKMDGYEAIRSIRQLEQGRAVPIIAITAKAMKDDRDKCVAAGANDYMTKPIDIERLLSLLKVWLV